MQSLDSLLEIYKTAVYNKNVIDFVSIYDQNVTVFDMWGVWSYEGKPAWEKMVRGWFNSLGAEMVRVEFESVKSITTETMANLSAIIKFKNISAEGKEQQSMKNRISWVAQKVDGKWKIIHEHTSAPLDFNTMKATLN